MKRMLKNFDIQTSKIYIKGGNKREKDDKINKVLRFNIKPASTDKFIKEINWLK